MDPKELLSLLGYNDAPVGFDGEAIPQNLPAPGVVQPVAQAPEAAPDQGYGGAAQDFTAKTYDFGNQGAKPMEYDAQGNLHEILPNGGRIAVSQDRQGYSAEKHAQIEAGPQGSKQMLKGEDALYKGVRDRWAPTLGAMATGNAQQLQAEDQLGQAEGAQIEARAGGWRKIADLHTQHAADMQRLNESTLLAKQQAKDEYRQKLLEIPQVNPNALWDEAGAFGQFQMSVAAFVHDMLGVKGIKTSAMDTINQAIRNKIDAQIANINTKKQVAAGFKDLYDMTVAESASQTEVKDRMHGYLLKAMEAGIDADMGKIDSNVARAKHQQAKMAIRQAQLKNIAEVESHIEANFNQVAERQVRIRGQNMDASIARQRNATELAVAQIRADAEKKGPNPMEGILLDVSESGGGLVGRRFIPGTPPDKQVAVREKTGALAASIWGIRKLRDLHKEAGAKPDFIGNTRLAGEATRAANAMSKYAQLSLAYAKSGKQLSAQEIKMYEDMFSNPTWFTNGDNVKKLAKLQEALAKEAQLTVAPHTYKIGPGDPLYNTKLGTADEYFGGELAEGNAIGDLSPLPPTQREMAEKGLNDAQAFYPDEHSSEMEKSAWSEFKAAEPKAAAAISKVSEYKKKRAGNGVKGQLAATLPDETTDDLPPRAHNDVRALAVQAASGQDPEARQALEKLASPDKDMPSHLKELQPLATYYLNWADTHKAYMDYKAR